MRRENDGIGAMKLPACSGAAMRNDIQVATVARQPAADSAMPLQQLVAEIAARREEFDRLSHVPRDVINSMKRAGIFRAATPRRFGGDACSPAEFLRMVEAIAVADGSAAWVAAFGSANTYLAALPLETQRKIYAGGPDQVFAGGLYPLQPARPAEGGVRVTGRWRFASGCMAADWIGVGISVDWSDNKCCQLRLSSMPTSSKCSSQPFMVLILHH